MFYKAHPPHQARFLPESKPAFEQWTAESARGTVLGWQVAARQSRNSSEPVNLCLLCLFSPCALFHKHRKEISPFSVAAPRPSCALRSFTKCTKGDTEEEHTNQAQAADGWTPPFVLLSPHTVTSHQYFNSGRRLPFFFCTPFRWKLNCLISAHFENWVSWIIHWPGGIGQGWQSLRYFLTSVGEVLKSNRKIAVLPWKHNGGQ